MGGGICHVAFAGFPQHMQIIVERPRGGALPRVVGNRALRGVPGGLLYLDVYLQTVGISVLNDVAGCFIAYKCNVVLRWRPGLPHEAPDAFFRLPQEDEDVFQDINAGSPYGQGGSASVFYGLRGSCQKEKAPDDRYPAVADDRGRGALAPVPSLFVPNADIVPSVRTKTAQAVTRPTPHRSTILSFVISAVMDFTSARPVHHSDRQRTPSLFYLTL